MRPRHPPPGHCDAGFGRRVGWSQSDVIGLSLVSPGMRDGMPLPATVSLARSGKTFSRLETKKRDFPKSNAEKLNSVQPRPNSNYGRLCTFWGAETSVFLANWICHQGSRQILPSI